jgi:hypothetical protein
MCRMCCPAGQRIATEYRDRQFCRDAMNHGDALFPLGNASYASITTRRFPRFFDTRQAVLWPDRSNSKSNIVVPT